MLLFGAKLWYGLSTVINFSRFTLNYGKADTRLHEHAVQYIALCQHFNKMLVNPLLESSGQLIMRGYNL